MSAPSVPSRTRQGQDYLAAVEDELADLPPDDRSALLEDLALHLEALAAEDDDRDIAVRVGAPSAYAAELRAAAGLPARGAPQRPAAPGLREWLDRLLASGAYRRALPVLREGRRLLVELRPAWWVLRGYLAVFVLSLFTGGYGGVVPAVLGRREIGLVLVIAAVAGSVALGRRMLSGPPVRTPARVLVAAGGVLVVLMSLAGWDRGGDSPDAVYGYDYAAMAPEQAMGEYPLLSRSGPVTDVFPYAADGTPLEDVLLYDQDGRPLQVGFQGWWADGCGRVLDQPLAADGVPVPHVFPQSYVLDPAGVDLSRSVPRPADTCVADLPRPDVQLPAFAGSDVASSTPAGPSGDAGPAAPTTPSGAPSPAPEPSVAPAPGD